MGKIRKVKPVKLFIGILYTSSQVLEKSISILEDKFGEIDLKSSSWNFDYTDYYKDEMGKDIKKIFISFKELINPAYIKYIKIYTNFLEKDFSNIFSSPPRPINLDPGYLSLSKVILTTTKDYSHRLYLGDGIYAEVTLRYYNKKFIPWEWTYPDYKTENYIKFFEKLRAIYKEQLKYIDY